MKIILFLLISLLGSEALFALEKVKTSGASQRDSEAVVFMYHRFGNSKYPSTNIRLDQFRAHLDYIHNNSFKVWKLSKILRYLKEHKEIPPKTVAISVDDAYISTYTNAYPMLKQMGYPFTVFVNTHPIDVHSKSYMSWDQMREMADNDVEFANHSLTHEYMLPSPSETKQEWSKRFEKEVLLAQKRLQEELGKNTNTNPKMFSYPFGEYNTDMAALLREMGFIGIAQESGVMSRASSFEAMPRYPMSERFGALKSFALKINTRALPIEEITPFEPVLHNNNPPILRLKLQEHMPRIGCFLSSGEKIDFKWHSNTELEVYAKEPLKGPRERYTCTAPAGDGSWYWYSHMWIIPSQKRGYLHDEKAELN